MYRLCNSHAQTTVIMSEDLNPILLQENQQNLPAVQSQDLQHLNKCLSGLMEFVPILEDVLKIEDHLKEVRSLGLSLLKEIFVHSLCDQIART